MIKKILKRVRLNFRQSPSDRKATLSYRNYHRQVVHFFKNVPTISRTKLEKEKFKK